MVKAARDAMGLLGEGEIIEFVGRRQPHPRFLAGIQLDPLGAAETEIPLKEGAAATNVDGVAVEVIDPADVHATGAV
jgi:hypothetical protein